MTTGDNARRHERANTSSDLHLHSTYSDGLKTPGELCLIAHGLGLSLIALTDHDTLDGLPALDAAARETCIDAIGGIELSAGTEGRTHILGYAPRRDDPALNAWLKAASEERRERAERMLDLLRGEGVMLDASRDYLLSCPQVGRAHIARAIISAGYVNTVKQAFERYLAVGRPAYVPRAVLPPREAIALLKGAGAVTVLAHPMRLSLDETAVCALITELRGMGLDGVEAYHPSATRSQAAALDRMARRIGLIVTGGSDYHGDIGSRSRMGRLPPGRTSAEDDARALADAIERANNNH